MSWKMKLFYPVSGLYECDDCDKGATMKAVIIGAARNRSFSRSMQNIHACERV